jgi:ubiquinone/menaquinone biosynthesis C-methylase UbiE
MENLQKLHWEKVYETKKPNEVSWTQLVPKTSLNFIHSFQLPKTASIIDVGGGDSNLIDHLLDEGFTDLTVLDISARALDNAKQRLGERAKKVNWIVSDITSFEPATSYDVWHDRATFHFLTTKMQVEKYIAIAERAVKKYMIIATFSESGPKKCSGLDVQQYNEEKLEMTLNNGFVKLKCAAEDHITPFNTAQNFLFCSFKKRE